MPCLGEPGDAQDDDLLARFPYLGLPNP